MPTAHLNGIDIYYEIEGEGRPLLLIAGLGANSSAFAQAKGSFVKDYTVITFDNRGVGRSSLPPGPYTIDQMGDDAAALVAHLDRGPVAAVGWSLGGSVLQSMLIRHGALLDRAVLLSAFPSYTGVQQGWLDCLLALRQSEAPADAQVMFGMAWGMTPRLLSDHDALAATAKLMMSAPYPTSFEGFAAQAHGLRRYDSRPGLPGVRTPTLVLVGAEDVLTPIDQSIEMAQLIPGSQLKVLPRGGHAMLAEYPADTIAAIRSYLGAVG
jgi:pimeloyl-ACP methyl ester carboxylesterase